MNILPAASNRPERICVDYAKTCRQVAPCHGQPAGKLQLTDSSISAGRRAASNRDRRNSLHHRAIVAHREVSPGDRRQRGRAAKGPPLALTQPAKADVTRI